MAHENHKSPFEKQVILNSEKQLFTVRHTGMFFHVSCMVERSGHLGSSAPSCSEFASVMKTMTKPRRLIASVPRQNPCCHDNHLFFVHLVEVGPGWIHDGGLLCSLINGSALLRVNRAINSLQSSSRPHSERRILDWVFQPSRPQNQLANGLEYCPVFLYPVNVYF